MRMICMVQNDFDSYHWRCHPERGEGSDSPATERFFAALRMTCLALDDVSGVGFLKIITNIDERLCSFMQSSHIWKRPGLQFPERFDTIFFDVDGVLIRTIDSFHATDIATAEYVAGVVNELDWGQREGKQLLTHDDVIAFKQAGGYNDDWDMCYLLVALCTARLREWRGTPLAERSFVEWAELAYQATLAGHGGMEWVRTTMPVSAQPDYGMIGEIYHEFYWGADELRKRYGREPRYLPDFYGFVHNEKMLFPPDFFRSLRAMGIPHLGFITGRKGPEVDMAMEMMETQAGERWWDVAISADDAAKPDPRALQLAITGIADGIGGGLYIGDTGDDLDVVKHYRAVKQESDPQILAAMLVYEHEVELYKERGADFVIRAVTDVVGCLPERFYDRI